MIKSLDYPYVSLRRNYFWLSSKRWSQCDQMVRLFFHIWPFEAMKISPIMWHICQSMLSNSPNKKWTVKILPSTCRHFQIWSHWLEVLNENPVPWRDTNWRWSRTEKSDYTQRTKLVVAQLVDRLFPTYTRDPPFESSHWYFIFLMSTVLTYNIVGCSIVGK